MKRQEANDLRVRQFGSAERIAFVCECADEDCRRSVLLSPGAFISRRENGELILYPGHEPLADAPMEAELDARLTAIRHQNESLIATTRELEMASDAPFVFLCECADSRCTDYVKLTLADYDTQRRERGFILCPGHRAPRTENPDARRIATRFSR